MIAKHKFTLVELLIVIAIIAALASMLLPALSKARDTAKRSLCSSNQKQIHQAWSMYANDYNEYMPVGYAAGVDFWFTQICHYTGLADWSKRSASNLALYRCPAEPKVYSEPNAYFTSYRYNSCLGTRDASLNPIYYRLMSVKTPGQCAVMSSMRNYGGSMPASFNAPYTVGYNISEWYAGINGDQDVFGVVHSRQSNYIFVDGHVSHIAWDKVVRSLFWKNYGISL